MNERQDPRAMLSGLHRYQRPNSPAVRQAATPRPPKPVTPRQDGPRLHATEAEILAAVKAKNDKLPSLWMPGVRFEKPPKRDWNKRTVQNYATFFAAKGWLEVKE